jgi:hypothetical protein
MNDLATADSQTARDVGECTQRIPKLKPLLPTLPSLATWDACFQPGQVQQGVVRQQWFQTSAEVLRDALSLLQLGSSWKNLGPGSTLLKYGNVLHVVGQAWNFMAVQLAGISSQALLRQTIQSGEQSSGTCRFYKSLYQTGCCDSNATIFANAHSRCSIELSCKQLAVLQPTLPSTVHSHVGKCQS